MTSGYDEAHREVDDLAMHRWRVEVSRADGTSFSFVVERTRAHDATIAAVDRGALTGAEVVGVTITKEQA